MDHGLNQWPDASAAGLAYTHLAARNMNDFSASYTGLPLNFSGTLATYVNVYLLTYLVLGSIRNYTKGEFMVQCCLLCTRPTMQSSPCIMQTVIHAAKLHLAHPCAIATSDNMTQISMWFVHYQQQYFYGFRPRYPLESQ